MEQSIFAFPRTKTSLTSLHKPLFLSSTELLHRRSYHQPHSLSNLGDIVNFFPTKVSRGLDLISKHPVSMRITKLTQSHSSHNKVLNLLEIFLILFSVNLSDSECYREDASHPLNAYPHRLTQILKTINPYVTVSIKY